jgi:hypothetical protein
MKRYEQPIKMAPRDSAGLIGKAQAPHIERRGYPKTIELRSGVGRTARSGRSAFVDFCSPFLPLEVTMANRAMNAKLQRARQQAREAAQLEFTKPAYILQTPKHELRAMAAACDIVTVRRIPSSPPRLPRARTYGDGTRRRSILTPDVYATGSRLIRSNRSEGVHG